MFLVIPIFLILTLAGILPFPNVLEKIAQERVSNDDPHAMPSISTDPTRNVRFPIPAINATAAAVKLTGLVNRTVLSCQIRIPSIPIMPYKTMVAPPKTPVGIVNTKAPNLGIKARIIAVAAATQYAAVE